MTQRKHLPLKEKKKHLFSLSESQLVEIKEAFDLFDGDRKGTITPHETKVILRALGFDVKSAEVYDLLYDHDKKDTGVVPYPVFVDISRSLVMQ